MADFAVSCLTDFPFYALLALSFLVSFRVHNFPDLALDASYALGMAMVVAFVKGGLTALPLSVAAIAAVPAGFAVGAATASLHSLRWPRLGKLLAGLVVSFAMFSVTFRVNLGATTHGLYGARHELNALRAWLSDGSAGSGRFIVAPVSMVLLAVVVTAVWLLLRGPLGLQLRVAGYRPALLVEAGGRPAVFAAVALGISNGIAALAGCFRAATDNYSDINTFGTFLFALASLLLGERVMALTQWGRQHAHTLGVQLLCPIVGGLLMSVLVQLSVLVLSSTLNAYLSCDIRLVVALVLLLAAANPRRSAISQGAFEE